VKRHTRTRRRRGARAALIASLAIASPATAQAPPSTCQFRGAPDALPERPSPLDSVAIPLGGGEAKLCYGRPSSRGRTVVGSQDPYGVPWRFGANEPTTLHLPFPARIGEVDVDPGAYSLYAIPEADRWTIVVNGNTARWGIPISADVRTDDVGSFVVPATALPEHVETLEFSFEPSGASSGDLIYRWERTTLRIPIARR